MPGSRFDEAVEFAQEHEVDWTRDPHAEPDRWGVHRTDPPPWNRLFGPVHARGPVSGVILRNGREVAQWGEPDRADLTFSVAKTYLALLAGVANRDGLLPDPDEPVVALLPGIGFDDAHNRDVTWMHLLTQTSEWGGAVHGIEDIADRYRQTAHAPTKVSGVKGTARPLQRPGTYWEYNDVRINQLSLALLHLFGRSLPEVFRESILEPLGATSDFQWIGYDQAWVDLPARSNRAARRVQSVPGGSHWGGGVSISARDQARVGQLMLDRGEILTARGAQQLIPAEWIDRMQQPCAIAPYYGMLVWLNRDAKSFPGASAESYLMVGAGGNYVWIDPAGDAVIVARWIDSAYFNEFAQRVTAALQREKVSA
jgi:CubicO group peptidase (beta-lactamase class C family)